MRNKAELYMVSEGLGTLTRELRDKGWDTSAGLLGGEDGYGAWYSNEIFGMHPFCWCGNFNCAWCMECGCDDTATLYRIDGIEVTGDEYWDKDLNKVTAHSATPVEENQCVNCRSGLTAAPNFWHNPTGSHITWYKYIGRSMEGVVKGDWGMILQECLNSIQVRQNGQEASLLVPDWTRE
jgi:hypothetical protein